jgi:hypothetical protein
MGNEFTVKIALIDDSWEVVDVKGGSGKKAKKLPTLPEDSGENLHEFRSVNIHMIRILDPGEKTNRWCVINRRKWWC